MDEERDQEERGGAHSDGPQNEGGAHSDGPQNEGGAERPRPKVVDKRVSSGASRPAAAKPVEPLQPEPVAAVPTPPDDAPPQGEPEPAAAAQGSFEGGPEGVWTPEQEAEAARMAQMFAETPSLDWVVNTAVNLAQIASVKLETSQPADASLAIDALSGILKEVGHRLANVETPLRQMLAELQMAYAQRVTTATPAVPNLQ